MGVSFRELVHSLGGRLSRQRLPAPWIGGQLWERVAPQAPFILTALAALACLVPVLAKFTLPAKAEAALPSK